MMTAILLSAASAVFAADATKKVHLFILSGQSNMSNLDANQFFTPLVTKAFPDDVIRVD